MPNIWVWSNNGVTGVIGEAGKAKLEQVRQLANEGSRRNIQAGRYGLDGDVWGTAYQAVGRIPVATFADGHLYQALRPFVTGTMDELHELMRHCHVHTSSFGIPLSNGEVGQLSREELTESAVSLSEVAEIFGLRVGALAMA